MCSCNSEWSCQHTVEFRQSSLASAHSQFARLPAFAHIPLWIPTKLISKTATTKNKGTVCMYSFFILVVSFFFLLLSTFFEFRGSQNTGILHVKFLSKTRQRSSHVTSDNVKIRQLDWTNHLSYFSSLQGKWSDWTLTGINCHSVVPMTYWWS